MSDNEELTPGGCLAVILILSAVMFVYWLGVESNTSTVVGFVTNKYQEPDPEATFTSICSVCVEIEPGETRVLRADRVYGKIHVGERYEFTINAVSRIRGMKKLDERD